jgi:predicted dehydrogenase
MQDIKVAIIGAGSAARLHLLAYRRCAHTRVTAICGTDAARAQAMEREFGVRAYLSIEDMLAREKPDLVSVTTLEWNHETPVLLSLAAGCHVLCEKVMAHSLAIGENLVAAARRAQRVLGVNYNYRCVPSHGLIKEALLGGEFGEPALFTAHMHSYLWAHMIDLMRYYFGDPVEVTAAMVDDQNRRPRVTTNSATPWMHADAMLYHPSVAVSASFRFRQPDFVATLSGSASVPIDDYYWSFALFGSAGALTVNGARRDDLGGVPRLGALAPRLAALPAFSYPESFDRSIAKFVDALHRGKRAPVSGEDGLAAMRLDAAVVESALNRRSVVLAVPASP